MDTEEPKMKKDEENENKVENKRKKVKEKKEKIINFLKKKLSNCFFQSNYVSDVDKVEYLIKF